MLCFRNNQWISSLASKFRNVVKLLDEMEPNLEGTTSHAFLSAAHHFESRPHPSYSRHARFMTHGWQKRRTTGPSSRWPPTNNTSSKFTASQQQHTSAPPASSLVNVLHCWCMTHAHSMFFPSSSAFRTGSTDMSVGYLTTLSLSWLHCNGFGRKLSWPSRVIALEFA
jgi:hypothetical protein